MVDLKKSQLVEKMALPLFRPLISMLGRNEFGLAFGSVGGGRVPLAHTALRESSAAFGGNGFTGRVARPRAQRGCLLRTLC